MLKRESISKSIEGQLRYLAFSLEGRGKLALYDLHKYCEDFSAHLLNQVYGYNLENLNLKSFNEPGMDLGDEDNEVAFQVTTNKKSKKINETLEKITEEQIEKYESFFVFIIGTKQSTYKITEALAERVNFTKDNILDIWDIISRVNSLPIGQMRKIDEFLKSEIGKVYSMFEGEEESTLLKDTPTLIFSNCKAMVNYLKEKHHPLNISDEEEKEMEEGIRLLMNALIDLPLETRKFFNALVHKSDYVFQYDSLCVSFDKMKRYVNISEQKYYEELKILKNDDLIKFDEDFEGNITIVLSGLCSKGYALLNIVEFVDGNEITLEEVLVNFNLSAFAIEDRF
ncbi:SMEK domain-containing protein [Bacillus cereus]|uniref:SMEK domain-containing protein n=1 Tax=Bacillus cereus TaxID=1396 RepID=UPI001124E287|nr:SMEK domain-containing protein [Bacillus cereus]